MKISLYRSDDGMYRLYIMSKDKKGIMKLHAYAMKIRDAIERNASERK